MNEDRNNKYLNIILNIIKSSLSGKNFNKKYNYIFLDNYILIVMKSMW